MGKNHHILSLSYGKDSIACLGAIEKLGWPIERIIHAEVWATDTIPADLPNMVEFKAKADSIIKERWGIEVEHVRSNKTAEKMFYHRRTKGNRTGEIMGWPMIKKCELQNSLKICPMKEAQKGNIVYIGIAKNELGRIDRLNKTKISPLLEIGWTEEDCFKWCSENSLLSPVYTSSSIRSGCWFCPCQPLNQLRLLRKNYPELWDLMLKRDNDSPVKFKANGQTVHDFEHRFQMEDEGIIYSYDTNFRWSFLNEELNIRWF